MNPLSYFYTIRSYVEAYAGLLGRRFLSLIWVGALCFVVWYYGSLFALGDFQPLASARNRMIAIAVIVLCWLVYFLVSTYRARKRDKELIEGIERDAEALAEGQRASEVEEVRKRLHEALALLRRVTRRRFGYVYQLPWYVIFGAPGSGKTTALTHSGLSFPLGDALGADGVQGVAGTRSCNWWFCEEAILVDTAGRYTVQDDLDGASKAGWEAFLNLLKRYRRSQPINGALVTQSISDIMTRDPDAKLEEVRAIRKRLTEMDEHLGARVPVYLVLTKADLLTGFSEFFDGLARTDREQVWGMTFDLADSDTAKDLPERFLSEFSLLQERVGAMLIERLQQEPDIQLRGRIFRFPAELSALKDAVHEILVELCSGSKLVAAPFVRGLYLASGTQTPDTRRGQVPQAVPRMRRSYFLTRLFNEVIFGEAALVMRDKRLTGRRRLLQRIAFAAAATLLVFVLASWTFAYFQNTAAIARAEERIDAYQQALRGIPVTNVSDTDFLRILPALDNLAAVSAGFDEGRVWPVSLGLDQRAKIESRQRDAYRRSLHALLLPRMLVQLQNTMRDDTDPNTLFDALKLYGMLGGIGPIDETYIAGRSRKMFASLYPEEGRSAVREALAGHAAAMTGDDLPALALDPDLIASARAKIASVTYADRAFALLERGDAAAALAPFVPADALGPVGERAFVRSSEQPLREGVPGFYTAEGYRTVVLPGIADAASEALREDWVRGSPATTSAASVDAVMSDAATLYFDNFRRRWSDLFVDMRIRPSQSLADATETVRLLASDPGPIETLAAAAARATDLTPGAGLEQTLAASGTAEAVGPVDPAANLALLSVPDPYADLRAALVAPEATTQDSAPAAPGAAAAGEPTSQIKALQPLIETIYQQLSRATTSTAAVAELFDADGQLTQANQSLLQEARRLPEPVATWIAGLSADISSLAVKTARLSAGEVWATEGASLCSAAVVNRYPFARASADDVAMGDFVRLFGPEGLFATFFQARLAAFVDTTTSPWKWRGTLGTEGIDSQAIAAFEQADQIRKAFFPPGSEGPSMAINIEPVSLSDNANAVMLEMEGTRVVYFHGPKLSKSIQWPSPQPQNRSLVRFQPDSGSELLVRSGDWSPFRLLDAARIESGEADRLRARFDIDGRSATFDVQFSSVRNPFDLPALGAFQCPTQF